MAGISVPYGRDLARVHHEAFGANVDRFAPGIVELLAPVLGGTVLEIGCGTGKLTRYLVEAGHRVVASDISPAMLDIAKEQVPNVEEFRVIGLPDDPLPPVDAVVATGHPLSYSVDEDTVFRALDAIAAALRPGGVLAFDLFDIALGEQQTRPVGRVEDGWALVSSWERLGPARLRRHYTTFVQDTGDAYRRADEQHDIALVDTASLPERLSRVGVDATVGQSLGAAELPAGLVALTGTKRSP